LPEALLGAQRPGRYDVAKNRSWNAILEMTRKLLLVHPNGKSRHIEPGFCWLGFLLPVVWSVSEGLWRPFAFAPLGHFLLMIGNDLAYDFKNPAFSLLGQTYFGVMIAFGVYGKHWLVSDLLAHGYREIRLGPDSGTSCSVD